MSLVCVIYFSFYLSPSSSLPLSPPPTIIISTGHSTLDHSSLLSSWRNPFYVRPPPPSSPYQRWHFYFEKYNRFTALNYIISYVSDLTSLVACSRDLNSSPIIAVDLEHHSQRSFLGIVCLMQLSTVSCDYIVDTLVRTFLKMCFWFFLMFVTGLWFWLHWLNVNWWLILIVSWDRSCTTRCICCKLLLPILR